MGFQDHLSSYKDLVTTYEATRAGFVAMALEKNRKAMPYIAEARALQAAAKTAKKPKDLLQLTSIYPALLTAAGVSDKASKHFFGQDSEELIKVLIENFLEPAGNKFIEELVFRFLLTKGDALGGSMRNLAGVLGERKLIRALIAVLSISGIAYHWFDGNANRWIKGTKADADVEFLLKGISWEGNNRHRTILFNLNVPAVKKNVDICLFNLSYNQLDTIKKKKAEIAKKQNYIALGELKAGIDPAGADEHWKTANSALNRIRVGFTPYTPKTFFVGAAIEPSMAKEIFKQLKKNALSNVANLTNEEQLASLCQWICAL